MAITGYDADPDHPVLPMAGYYEVVRVDWHLRQEEPFLDRWAADRAGGDVVALRFWSPQQVSIDAAFYGLNSGFRIKDISGRGLEVRVAVTTFEQGPAIRFVAGRVARLDAHSEA